MSVNNNKKYLIDEIKRLERENLDIYKDMLKLQKRIDLHKQRVNDIVYKYGHYCLHKLCTNECDIPMLYRWFCDYMDAIKIEKELTDEYNKLEHTYFNNQIIIKDLKIDAHIFPDDIKWVSRSKNE